MVVYVGLSGTMLAGKGFIKDILSSHFNVFSFSLSDALRDEADRQGIEKTRQNLTDLADGLRLKHGPGVLGELAIKKIAGLGQKISEYDLVIIDSIRNPWEVEALRQTFKRHFYLIFTDAPIETRYGRAMSRKREGEEFLSFEDFKKKDEEEFKGRADRQIEDEHSHHGQKLDYGVNLGACLKKSNAVISNEGSKEEIEKKVLSLVNQRIGEASKPVR